MNATASSMLSISLVSLPSPSELLSPAPRMSPTTPARRIRLRRSKCAWYICNATRDHGGTAAQRLMKVRRAKLLDRVPPAKYTVVTVKKCTCGRSMPTGWRGVPLPSYEFSYVFARINSAADFFSLVYEPRITFSCFFPQQVQHTRGHVRPSFFKGCQLGGLL